MRRVIWSIVLPLAFFGILIAWSAQAYFAIPVDSAKGTLAGAFHSVLFGRNLDLQLEDRDLAIKVRKALASDKSNFWWRMNTSKLNTQVLAIPSVESARVVPCYMLALGCYRIEITPKKAVMLTELANGIWETASDGRLIKLVSEVPSGLPVARGPYLQQLNTQDLRSVLSSAAHTLGVFNSRTNLEARIVYINPNGDLIIKAKDQPTEFVMTLQKGPEIPALDTQASRLAALIKDGSLTAEHPAGVVKRVDVTYRQLAVISRS